MGSRLSLSVRAALLGSTLALSLLAGCASGAPFSTPTASTPTTTTTTTPTTPTTPAPSVKTTLKGLVTMGPATPAGSVPANNFEELYAHPGVYSAAVIELFWSQLEPSQGVFDDSSLVAGLNGIAAYNAKYPSTPVVAKLRIFMGLGTPQWVISATGAVTLTDPTSGTSGTIGEFWTPAYRTLWQALQTHLASEYDTNATVAEVAITSCSSLTGEPFIIPNGKDGIAAFHAAGYTDAQAMTCLSGAPADYAAWKYTPLDFTFNPYVATDTGVGVAQTTFPIQIMDAFRAALGTRAVVANHGLQPTLSGQAPAIYTEFTNLYNQAVAAGTISPLEFQTVSPTVDWPTSITDGLTFHPTEIEIWDTVAAGGQAPLSQSQLAGWAASLK